MWAIERSRAVGGPQPRDLLFDLTGAETLLLDLAGEGAQLRLPSASTRAFRPDKASPEGEPPGPRGVWTPISGSTTWLLPPGKTRRWTARSCCSIRSSRRSTVRPAAPAPAPRPPR